MLAFDLKQPWSCHQTYKLFDEKYSDIFGRPEVTAQRVYVLDALYLIAEAKTPSVAHSAMGRYRLTTFFLLYLLRRALEETDPTGKALCQNPADYLSQPDGLGRIKRIVDGILADMIFDVNEEMKERISKEPQFDYKSALKSPVVVPELAKGIIPNYQRGVRRDRATSFEKEWNKPITK
jgi:hypothetical protein